MNRTKFIRPISAMCLMCIFIGTAATQTVTGSLVGHIEDVNGGSVPGARVVITDVERGTSRDTVTNEEGNYTLSSLEPGVYRVEIEGQNFKKFVSARSEVAINTTVRVDAKLEPGGATETVEVSGEQALLKTDRGDLSTQITREQVEELPLSPDRNFQSLLELVPGASEPAASGSAFGNPGGALTNSFNGQNNRYNGYQLDGTINNQTNVTSQIAIVPPPDAIQIVDVSTNAYDAEQGRATGGVVNVQIKSGTNDLHGTAFYFNSNSALRARNTLSTLNKPTTNLTQFGFTLGGPIRRDKTFFFGDYQGGRDRRGQEGLFTVPTQDFRNGNFAASTTAIFDPATGTSASNRTQFRFNGVNNVIDPARISPVARNILARLPLPNRPGLTNNYEAATKFSQNRDSFDIKINQRFSDRTEGFVRYSYFKAFTSDPPAFGILGGPPSGLGGSTATAAIGPARDQSASINLTHTLSSTLVTELRGGFVRVLITGDTPTEADLATQVGIPGINTGDFFTPGIPRITISGFDFLGAAATVPFKIAETSYNIVNNWTNVRGNHTIRFGADVRDLILNPLQSRAQNPRGEFGFTTGPTSRTNVTSSSSNAFAAFLLGLAATGTRTTVQQEGGYRQRQYFFYAQDRWQVNPKLTINYGLRYELYPFAIVPNPGDQSRYDINTNQLLIAGYGSVNKQLNVKTPHNNFAPRLGIAYRLDDKTVLRGGYGISYIPFAVNSLNPGNFPAQPTVQPPTGVFGFFDVSRGFATPPVLDVSSGVIPAPNTLVFAYYNPNPRRGYTQSFNLTFQRDIRGFVAEAAYVGNLGTRLPGLRNINAAPPRIGGARATDRPLAATFGRTADTQIIDFMLSTSYHALQAKIERRFSRGSKLTVSYTFSKSLDYTDAFTIPNPLDDSRNRGLSPFDRKHNFVVSHVIRLPGRGNNLLDKNGLRLGGILGGWQLNGVFSARSGTPIDITGVNLTENRPLGFTNRPNVISQPNILGGTGGGALFFDTSVFVEPAPGTLGNVGRNTVRGPKFFNYNASIFRNFTLGERLRMQFRAEGFNVTNTPHFNDPSGNFTSANFGRITTSFGERQIRFGLRFLF